MTKSRLRVKTGNLFCQRPLPPASAGKPADIILTGTADQIAADVRQYQDMGVNYLVVDFARMSSSLDEMLGHMENTANRVVPRV